MKFEVIGFFILLFAPKFFAFICYNFRFSQIHGFGSINLKSMQTENSDNVVPPSSRSSNYIALRYCDVPSETTVSFTDIDPTTQLD